MACKNITEALSEDIIEITWMFDNLRQTGEIKSWDEITDGIGSDEIKNTIKDIARKFEGKYPFETSWEDPDVDYIEAIETFAKEKLIEVYGKEQDDMETDMDEDDPRRKYCSEKALDIQNALLDLFSFADAHKVACLPAEIKVDDEERLIFQDKASWKTMKDFLKFIGTHFIAAHDGNWTIQFL